jgi:hypothetical protein
MNNLSTYNADSIQALTGLAHVRHRPLMYLGSAGIGVGGLHHLIWEIVDNSVDEAMAGNGDRIIVTLHKALTSPYAIGIEVAMLIGIVLLARVDWAKRLNISPAA